MLWLIGGIVMAAVVTVMFLRGRPSASASPVPANPRIFAPLVRSGSAFYAPTIIAKGLLLPPMIQSASVFYSTTVLKGETVSPPLVASGSAFYAPSINQNLVAPLVASSSQFYAATVVTASGQALVVPLIASASQFYGPKVNQNLAVPLVASGSVFYGIGLFTGSTPGSLSTPSVTLVSAAGDAPEVDITMGADIYAGFYLKVQRSQDGIRNVSDGSYANATVNILHQVQPNEVAAGEVTNADLAIDGYVDPVGTWYLQYRWEREDGAISAWSNQLNGVVTASVAALSEVTGANKSKFITVTGSPKKLTGTHNANDNTIRLVRATVPGASNKFHFETEVAGIYSGGGSPVGTVAIGVADAYNSTTGAGNFNANGVNPGVNFPGVVLSVKKGSTATTLRRNGASVSATALDAAPAIGDVIMCEFDRTASSYTFKYKRLATGTVKIIATGTLTTQIPATPYAVCGVFITGDSFTANFGETAFAIPATAGYDIYG